jgi:polyhydroxybutyrate depolymerase
VVIVVALLAVAGCVAVPPPKGSAPDGCGKPASPVYLEQHLLMSAGVVRKFLLTIPDNYNPGLPAPLVLDLHPGRPADGMFQAVYSGLDLKGKQRGFIVVTPDAAEGQSWDDTAPSADFTFIEDLVRYVDSILCVSPTLRFSAGASAGGFMSSAVACLPALHLKAIAGVTGLLSACANGTKVPVLSFHGTADPNVGYAGAETAVQSWASRDGCRPTPGETRIEPDIQKRTYVRCDAGLSVTFYTVEGGGHTWPDGAFDIPGFGPTTHTINASDLILDFFAAQ